MPNSLKKYSLSNYPGFANFEEKYADFYNELTRERIARENQEREERAREAARLAFIAQEERQRIYRYMWGDNRAEYFRSTYNWVMNNPKTVQEVRNTVMARGGIISDIPKEFQED